MQKKSEVGRLALRREGPWWNAYYASGSTMEGSVLLGSILLSVVERSDASKRAFMDVMRGVVADAIVEATGRRPSWNAPRPAPEGERGGSA